MLKSESEFEFDEEKKSPYDQMIHNFNINKTVSKKKKVRLFI